MRIIVLNKLAAFWRKHADAQGPLVAWALEVKAARWTGPEDVKARYASASFLAGNRLVFNIGGNKYRLVVKVVYAARSKANKLTPGKVFIRFIGTHAAYDRIDATTI